MQPPSLPSPYTPKRARDMNNLFIKRYQGLSLLAAIQSVLSSRSAF